MAEFCLDCWNKINETNDSKWRYVCSEEYELCEECGEYRQVIIVERLWSSAQRNLADMYNGWKQRQQWKEKDRK